MPPRKRGNEPASPTQFIIKKKNLPIPKAAITLGLGRSPTQIS